MIRKLLLTLCVVAFPAAAQQASEAAGAQVRGVDKITGEIYDMRIKSGETVLLDQINITLNSCRYPLGNPAGDAFAFLDVTDVTKGESLFSGWMIASSPALSAMEHPRYDIWVIRCTTS